MPEVSVIICAYNAASTLPRCLDSIVKQTFGDFEIILVDDCSTDETLAIANRYAAQDCRIRIFHNEKNRGISYSRQRAMDNATGRYTIHADADDHIDPTMLQSLHEAAIKTGADVVICDYFEDRQRETSYITQRPTSTEPRQIIIDLLTGRLHGSCCNKLIAKSIYTNGNIKYPIGINSMEDLLVCIAVFNQNPQTTYLPHAFYHYNKSNESSITTIMPSPEMLSHDNELLNIAISIFREDIEMQQLVKQNIAWMIVSRAFYSKTLTSKQFHNNYAHLKKTILQNPNNSIIQRLIFAAACCGLYKFIIPINNFYAKLWHHCHKNKLLTLEDAI